MNTRKARGLEWIFLLSLLAMLRSWRMPHAFNLTHWLFSYELGPIKRGLPGELLSRAGWHPTLSGLQVLSTLLMVLGCIYLWRCFTKPAKLHPDQPGGTGFALLALTSSATLQRLAWDTGRFDVLGLLLMAIGLWTGLRIPSRLMQALFQALICILMILIHEAQAFLFIPTFLVLGHIRQEDTRDLQMQPSMVLWLTSVTFALIWSQKAVLPLEVDEYIKHLGSKGIVVDSLAAQIPLRDLNGNFRYHYGLVFRPMVAVHHIVFIAGSFPLLFIAFSVFRKGLAHTRRKTWIIEHMAALSPLALYIIGLDHFRWWAAALTNLFLLWATHMASASGSGHWLFRFFEEKRKWILVSIVFAFVSGSLGDFNSFALWDWAVRFKHP